MNFDASSLSAIEADLNRLRAELASFSQQLQRDEARRLATSSIPAPIRTHFDGTKSQLKSWRITVEDRLSSDCAHLTPRQKWIFVYDGLTDQIQKQLSYYFGLGEALEWSAVAFFVRTAAPGVPQPRDTEDTCVT
ncbi:hypothetical protein E4U16_000835 [Claviceps sp. LM84 group G4]|nr:hypothetical protein E4U16_000835 [Claviceps sp. LM84 group G4]